MGASSESDDSKSSSSRTSCLICWAYLGTMAAVFLGLMIFFSTDSDKTPRYTAVITAVSGLDPETDLQQSRPASAPGTLSPAFNLTVGVASGSVREGARIGPGTSVKITYSHLRLPMATGLVAAARVGPRESAVQPVVARGRDVAVPGFLMDSLAEEMSSGEAMFEVQLMESDKYGWRGRANGWGKVGDTIRLT